MKRRGYFVGGFCVGWGLFCGLLVLIEVDTGHNFTATFDAITGSACFLIGMFILGMASKLP